MTVKKQSGSPAENQSRASKKSRPHRVPVGGNRDILTVLGTDPEFVYRWVKDREETGQRIFKFSLGGYSFVDASEARDLGIGESDVYESHDTGSLIRKSAGSGEYLYLMKILREFYEEDQAVKQKSITEREDSLTRERDPNSPSDDGQYGTVKIN